MNIHEYQAKAVLREFGVPVPRGIPAYSASTRRSRPPQELGGPVWVVKAQIHAGGRGKAGGVKVVKSIDDVKQRSDRASSARRWSPIRPARRARWSTALYIEEGSRDRREFYLSLLVDRETARVAFVVSTEGGMDIEEVAHDDAREDRHLHGRSGDRRHAASRPPLAQALGLDRRSRQADRARCCPSSTRAFIEKDMSLLEINPLVVTNDGQAHLPRRQDRLRRQRALPPPRDRRAARPDRGGRQGDRGLEVRPQLHRARRQHRLHGQRRRARHGDHGHHQALRRGSRPTSSTSAAAPPRRRSPRRSRSSPADPNVKGILVNIFGGIMKCDVIAEGVVAAVKEVGLKVPLVVRLEGTNVELGKKILASPAST